MLLLTAGCASSQEGQRETPRDLGAVSVAFVAQVEGVTCPEITSYLVEPAEVFLGGTISVSASAVNSGDAGVEIRWSAPTGTFADPHAAATSYSCGRPGSTDLTLDVFGNGCTETLTSAVECDEPD